MDIARPAPRKHRRLLIVGLTAAAALVLALVAVSQANFGMKKVARSSVSFAQVAAGNFAVKVFGSGVLVPKEVRWVAANVAGRVQHIAVKPGARVAAGDTLLSLHNPELVQLAEESEWEVEATRAELESLRVQLESDVLDQRAQVKTAEIDLESARMQFDAEATLVRQGLSNISALDHKRSELKVKQLQNALDVARERLDRLQKNTAAQLDARRARLKKLENSLLRAQRDVASLNVVAQSEGVVQEVPIALGQQLGIGANLVKMADQTQLIAELRIPERMINDVLVGQKASIDTRKSVVEGVVVRIDPGVTSGSVLVEIAFSTPLPAEARPDLTVSGQILVAEVANTLSVQRPVTAQSEQAGSVYKYDAGTHVATRASVRYGKGASDRIEILSGLSAGDMIIVSDHSGWEHLHEIRID